MYFWLKESQFSILFLNNKGKHNITVPYSLYDYKRLKEKVLSVLNKDFSSEKSLSSMEFDEFRDALFGNNSDSIQNMKESKNRKGK